jgi:predicted outer membrane repeat protein
MSSSSDIRLQKDIYMSALCISDDAERERFLVQSCGDNAALLQRLQKMLKQQADDVDEQDEHSDELPTSGEKVGYFGDYVLLDEIARGSMGVVFRARQVSLDRIVAVKMLRDSPLMAGDEATQRLHAEATAAASLDHPNILPIYEVGTHEGQWYYSMKLIKGGTLQFRMGEYQQHQRKAVLLMIKVARAMQHAHEQGLLHRDLKPGNILIDATGEPHIADFGLARKIGMDGGLTMSGQIMGTPHYMSPEQARGENKNLTPSADIYSLGAILYEMLAGRRLFANDELLALLKQVAETPAPPLPDTVPPSLAKIVLRTVQKQPAARYGTAGELADALEHWLSETPTKATAVRHKPTPLWWLVSLPVLALLLFFWFKPVPAASTTLTVTTTADELDPPGVAGSGVSLREAVREAPAGAVIRFEPSVFTKGNVLTLSADRGEIVIEKNLALDASALPQGLTLHSPEGGYRKLSIAATAVVSLQSITFTAQALATRLSAGQGGAILNDGTLTLRDCRFIKNGGAGNGGAIHSSGGLTLERCLFEGNHCLSVGGALNVEGDRATAHAVDCVFRGNVAAGNGGGGINVARNTLDGQVTLEHCTLVDNAATAAMPRGTRANPARGSGGAIRIHSGTVEISHCVIAGNRSAVADTEHFVGQVKQTGPNYIGADPKAAPAGLGAR